MASAIIRSGGKQFRAQVGDVLRVPSLDKEVGDPVQLEALLVADGADVNIGGGSVSGTVVANGRGDKIIVFKKKRRKQYKRKQGHRQGFTTVKIDSIG
jgi:large subunit ribosomal protein L21